MNEFYKDYRNKKILFDDAIQIVKLELRGQSNEIIEEHKRWQRVRTSRQTMSDSVFIDKYFEHLRILDSLEKK